MRIDINTRDLAKIINGTYDLNGNKVDVNTTETILDYIDDCGAEMDYEGIIYILQNKCTVYSDEGDGCIIDDFITDYKYLWTEETHSEYHGDVSPKNVLTFDRNRYLENLIEAAENTECVLVSEKAIIVMK